MLSLKADFHGNGIRWNLERFWTVFSYSIYDFFFQQQEMDAGMMVRVWILGESLIVCPPDNKLINRETLGTRAECTSCDTENIRNISGMLSRVNLAWEKTKPQAATTINLLFYGLFVRPSFATQSAILKDYRCSRFFAFVKTRKTRLRTLNSPLWGCVADRVEMVVKVHCGAVLGDEFAAMLNMRPLKQSHNALWQPSRPCKYGCHVACHFHRLYLS